MKKYSAFLLAITFAACHRGDVKPDEHPKPYMAIPYSLQDSLFGTKASMIPNIKLYNVSGYFMSGIRIGDMVDTAGNLTSYSHPMQMAQFIDSAGTFLAPDSVSLNNWKLWPLVYSGSQQIAIFHNAISGLWNNSGSNQWSVVPGNSQVPAINTSITLSFPQFNTDLPDSLDLTQPYNFTFGSNNLQQADSAFIMVYSYTGNLWTSQVVQADGGTATVDCSASVANSNVVPLNTLFNLQGHIYYGGILVLVAYRTEVHATGGKNFAYVVQTQKIKNVVLLY